MSVSILSESEGDIALSETTPTFLWEYKIPESRYFVASGQFGDILLQETNRYHYTLWYNTFLFKKGERMTIGMKRPAYVLRFILSNTFYYSGTDNGVTPMYEWSYNFLYLSPATEKVHFRERMYASFDIHFEPGYLFAFTTSYQHLANWLEVAVDDHGVTLCKVNQVATTGMIRLIQELLNSPWEGALRSIHFDAVVTELLLKVLHETDVRPRKKPMRISTREVEMLYEVKAYLMKHMDRPIDLEELAARFDSSERTLKRRFYALFGIRLYQFLLDIRMEQASLLLLETDTSIESIATSTGYRSFANFSTAFKKYYGHPPKYFRSR